MDSTGGWVFQSECDEVLSHLLRRPPVTYIFSVQFMPYSFQLDKGFTFFLLFSNIFYFLLIWNLQKGFSVFRTLARYNGKGTCVEYMTCTLSMCLVNIHIVYVYWQSRCGFMIIYSNALHTKVYAAALYWSRSQTFQRPQLYDYINDTQLLTLALSALSQWHQCRRNAVHCLQN